MAFSRERWARCRAKGGRVRSFVAASAMSIAATACSNPSPPSAPAPVTTIRLVQNPWDASRLDVAIAYILLTEQMGLGAVVTETDEYSQWPLLASGAEHACLEVWPSGHQADIQRYVDHGQVDDVGLLGPVGKISWYVPTYLLTSNPALATWQAYASPSTAQLFATPATGSLGQFTGGDPSWTSYDADIIKNLGLDLKVVDLGSEDDELKALDSAYQARQPILLYLWTPHAAVAKYEMTPVQLPAYSADCYAKVADGGVACDYPTDHLFKIVWPALKTANPRAYAFLQAFALTTEDQLTLLNLVDNEHEDIPVVARYWVDANTTTWQKWIPAK
jgi:glycine betaine/proline transport system substrate-binding protein